MKTRTLDSLRDGDALVEILKSGGHIPLVVTGSSMLPFLRHERDIVWLRYTDHPQQGQILCFRRDNGMFILHRIRRILPDGTIIVNGDAQTWCEEVRPEQTAAVVTAITREGKTIPADSLRLKLRDALWHPTRPIRPLLFRVYGLFRKLFRRS